jgi:hypothetical protein
MAVLLIIIGTHYNWVNSAQNAAKIIFQPIYQRPEHA